jgi:hypothetical protein
MVIIYYQKGKKKSIEYYLKMKFDVIEYLGKYEEGVMVLLSLNYNDEYYDATFFYKDNFITLTVDEQLEEILECTIEKWSEYGTLVVDILKKVIPYDEIINRLDELDFNEYFKTEE